MKRVIMAATTIAALVSASVAAAGVGCPPKHDRSNHAPCVQYNHITKKCHVPGPTGPPVVPPTTTPPPVTGGPPPVTVKQPPINPSIPTEDFCVQTKEAGETYVQTNVGAFSPGGAWYDLWHSGATVNLDNHARSLEFEPTPAIGNGVILAAHVPTAGGGWFATCGQPFVDTNGKYADASYGNR